MKTGIATMRSKVAHRWLAVLGAALMPFIFAGTALAFNPISPYLSGPSTVQVFASNGWTCDMQYVAYGNLPSYYGLNFQFTFQSAYFATPSVQWQTGPISLSGFNSGTDPNYGYQDYVSSGSALVFMSPGQNVTEQEGAGTYAFNSGNSAFINCTTGSGHEYDNNQAMQVYIGA